MAASIFALGMFWALAFMMAVRSAALVSGSGPPAFAAMVMVLPSRGKTLDIIPHRFSLAALRYSNALPIFLINYINGWFPVHKTVY
jgi:hypothetical protein